MNVAAIRPSFDSDSDSFSRPVEKFVSPETKTKREIKQSTKRLACLKKQIQAEERRLWLQREGDNLAAKLEELRNVK